jgi:hypothetical protein
MATYPYALTITNPDAETGDTTGWTNVQGALAVSASQGGATPHSGSWFFTAGATLYCEAYQDIAVPAGVQADVDAGDLQVEFGGWQAGYSLDSDLGNLMMEFFDAGSNSLGICSSVLETNVPTWNEVMLRSTVPPLTRTIRLTLNGRRFGGTNNDAYFDDLTLQLIDASTQPIYPTNIPLINPGAESGVVGWTNDVGTLAQAPVGYGRRTGARCFVASNSDPSTQCHQDVTIPAILQAGFDTGALTATFPAWQGGAADNDNGHMELEALDAGLSSLGSVANADTPVVNTYIYRSLEYADVPTLTRTLRLSLYGTRVVGPQLTVLWDEMNVVVTAATAPAQPTIEVTGLAAALGVVVSAFDPSPAYPADLHYSTTYQATLTTDPGFASPVLDETKLSPSPEILETLLDPLAELTTFLVRVRQTGTIGGDSPWSATATATTLVDVAKPDAPTITINDVGEDYVDAVTSAFNSPTEPLAYLSSVRWQIRDQLTSTIGWDSGLVPAESDPPTLLYEDLTDDTGYEIRALHYDGYLNKQSNWGPWKAFATDAVPLVQPDAPDVTVASCDGGGRVELTATAFNHPDPLATHKSTRWRADTPDGRAVSVVTSDAAELTAYTWEQLPPGDWTFDAAYRDDSDRWGAYGNDDTCTTLEPPPPPIWANSGSMIACANLTLVWNPTPTPVAAWDYTGQISADDGATWTNLFGPQTINHYHFKIKDYPDGLYLVRVRASYPAAPVFSDWAYLALRVDRTCAATTHYDFSQYSGLDPGWEVLWQGAAEDVTWGVVDEDGAPGAGLGIMGSSAAAYKQRRSILAFPELGQPTTYEAEVEFIIFGEECRWYPWRWMHSFLMRGGIGYACNGYTSNTTRSGFSQAVSCGQGIYSGPPYGEDPASPCTIGDYGGGVGTVGLCDNNCACASGCDCYNAISSIAQTGNNYPNRHIEYGVPSGRGRIYHWGFRSGLPIQYSYSDKPVDYLGAKSRGLRVSTSHETGAGACYWRHHRYILRQKVTRTVSGGILMQAKVMGPGLDPEAGWSMEKVISYTKAKTVGCGYVGLSLDQLQSYTAPDKGIVFTSFAITPTSYDECQPPSPIPEPEPEPEPEPGEEGDWGRPCSVVLFVYDEDRETVKWQVGDYREHPQPYLCLLENYGEQEVDPVAGAVTIGQVEVVVIDRRQTPGDQDSGWLTERLGVSTVGAIHGRRCRVIRYISEALGWVVIADGPASTPEMDESYSAFRWIVKDTRETERKVKAFVRADTSWLVPMGIEPGFGAYVDGDGNDQWLVEPATPLIGEYAYDPLDAYPVGTVNFQSYWSGPFGVGGIPIGDQVVDNAVVINNRVEEMMLAASEELGAPKPVLWTWPDLEILWRLQGSGDPWTVVEPTDLLVEGRSIAKPTGAGQWWRSLVTPWDAETAEGTEVRGVLYMTLRGYQATGTFPTDGDTIEVAIRYTGEPTEDFPLHIEGMTSGEFLKQLYDGEYSPPNPVTGAIQPTAIRYNETDLLRMGGGVAFISLAAGTGSIALASGAGSLLLTTSPTATDRILLRQTEVVDDLRAWAEEHVYSPTGWFPALNNDGEISPRNQVPPETFEGLIQITNAVTEPMPDWDAGERIVNVLEYIYPRYYVAGIDEVSKRVADHRHAVRRDARPADSVDPLLRRDITQEYRDEASITRHALQKVSYDGDCFSAIGDTYGNPIVGGTADEQGSQLAGLRRLYVFDRYRNGAPTIQVPVTRAHVALLRAGDWTVVDLTWFPDYVTERRGLLTGTQVLAIYDVDCAWRILLLEEAFPITVVS